MTSGNRQMPLAMLTWMQEQKNGTLQLLMEEGGMVFVTQEACVKIEDLDKRRVPKTLRSLTVEKEMRPWLWYKNCEKRSERRMSCPPSTSPSRSESRSGEGLEVWP